MVETIVGFLEAHLSPLFVVFVISMLPLVELRGGIIAAKLMGVPLAQALPVSIIGNMIPVPFIIFFIIHILRFLKEHGPIKKFAGWIETKGMTKGEELMSKYPHRVQLGLFLFVAIPLPGTGAWTGALVAALLGIAPKKSAPPICLGIVGASLIMSLLAYALPSVFGF